MAICQCGPSVVRGGPFFEKLPGISHLMVSSWSVGYLYVSRANLAAVDQNWSPRSIVTTSVHTFPGPMFWLSCPQYIACMSTVRVTSHVLIMLIALHVLIVLSGIARLVRKDRFACCGLAHCLWSI